MSRNVAIGDFLTEAQMKLAWKCKSAREICEKVTLPNLDEINRKLRQENDPMYLAYMIEYAMGKGMHSKAARRKRK